MRVGTTGLATSLWEVETASWVLGGAALRTGGLRGAFWNCGTSWDGVTARAGVRMGVGMGKVGLGSAL